MQGSDTTGHIWEMCQFTIILDEVILSKFVKKMFRLIIDLVVKAWYRQELNFIFILVINTFISYL